MPDLKDEDTSSYPALGRAMLWVDRPGSADKVFWGLVIACALVFALGFTYTPHGEFMVEQFSGFHALYGFVSFVGLLSASIVLKRLLSRDESYYGDKIVDAEDYPTDQLAPELNERRPHDD